MDLYFFYGVDIVLLNVEVAASDLHLSLAQELMYRFGRAYPAGWDARRPGGRTAWPASSGSTRRARCWRAATRSSAKTSSSHLAEHRAPRISEHWDYVLAPLVNHHSGKEGPLRFRQIEYYRMPMMAYLAVDEPRLLTRSDFIRLGLVTGGGETVPGNEVPLPFSETHVADFEQQFCYDRFWAESGAAPNTRYLCSGLALIAVGDARSDFYRCGDRGVLAQFRHQHFLLFLIAHFQKATLLMVSDQLAEALNALDITQARKASSGSSARSA